MNHSSLELMQLLNSSFLSIVFYVLTFLLIALIIVYFVQRRNIKKSSKAALEKNFATKEIPLIKAYELMIDYFSKGLYKEGIISSYNALREFIFKSFDIKPETFETEKEIMENHYTKIKNLNQKIEKLYEIYEKARFGKGNFNINELDEYKSYYLKIIDSFSKNVDN
ncbi:MAG: hypothetical protein RXR31_05705 [Thermoproteota archaeon]|jgi:hypothetical protein